MEDLFDNIKASALAAKTSDAYMFDMYGRSEWIKCIIFMYRQDLEDDVIEELLRSKHMRWADDQREVNEYHSDAFQEYFFKYRRPLGYD